MAVPKRFKFKSIKKSIKKINNNSNYIKSLKFKNLKKKKKLFKFL
jgi:hypothetical protein